MHYAGRFYGWEAETVVAVTSECFIMELVTGARIHLSLILVVGSNYRGCWYTETKKYFEQVG